IWSHQPFKAIYTVFTVSYTVPLLAFYYIIYRAKRFRPHPAWSYQLAYVNKVMQRFYHYAVDVHLKPVVHMTCPKKLSEPERHVLVDPGPSELYTGVTRSNDDIQPTPMPAIWFPRLYDPEEDSERPIILHLQGGAYTHAGDPLQTALFPTFKFRAHFNALTFFAQYRVSRTEDTRFPAALQDSITFYSYLLDQGVSPDRIIVSGDSAGGNLVLAFARYLSEHEGILSLPRGIMVWSPWVDLRDATSEGYKTSPHRHTDFVGAHLAFWGTSAFVPKTPKPLTPELEAYISPILSPSRLEVPLFINACTAEILYDQIQVYSDAMQAVEGNEVLYVETEYAPHDLIMAAGAFGLVKEVDEALEAAREF
ncbi:Alpha/Beta hydrolase protein, partial [Lophiotrema nucula]